MTRKILVALFFMACVVLMSQGSVVMAQNGTSPVKFFSKSDVTQALAGTNWGIGGQTFPIIAATPPTMASSIIIRHREEGRPNDASVHSTETDKVNATEVGIILTGGGTFITGGDYVDTNPEYAKKDRTKGITGGVTRQVKAGDVVVIPPGTSHWFSKVNGEVTLIEARFPGGAPGPAKFTTYDEVKEGLAKVTWGIGGQTFPIIAATPPTMASSIIFRHREEGRPQDASVHSTETDKVNATEVVVVLNGGGTFITGGTYVDDNPEYTKKDRAKGITGGVTRQVKAGDVIVIPPGTSHWFSHVDGQVTMVETRFPGDVTKSK